MDKCKIAIFLIGGLVVIGGFALFIVSLLVFPNLIENKINSTIFSKVIVDSPDSFQYSDWAGENSVNNYFLQYYYAWNLTNPNDVILGKKPIYESVGPFNYRYNWEYLNVSFSDNGNLAQYSQKKTYTYDGTTYPGLDPSQVSITNLNPAYLGLMLQFAPLAAQFQLSSEDLLFIVGGSGQMNQFLQFFNSKNFTSVAYFVSNPVLYNKSFQALNTSLVGVVANPVEYIYQQWANATAIPAQGASWNGMLTSLASGQPSGISMKSAQLIFNASNPYSILNDAGLNVWISAYFQDGPSIKSLIDNLGLSASQLDVVMSWWVSILGSTLTTPYFTAQCNIPDLELLGVCQFINLIPLQGKSIATLTYVGQPYTIAGSPVEIASFSSPLTMTPQQAQQNIFSGPLSILGAIGIGEMFNASTSGNYTAWNISVSDGGNIVGYFSQGISPTYTAQSVQALYNNTGGFITTRTVDQWLWNCEDVLLDFLGIVQNCGLQQNGTISKPTTINTGKNNPYLTNTVTIYQTQTNLTAWNGTVAPAGYTESGQFAPNVPVQQNLTIFDENVLRPLNLTYAYNTSVDGIQTCRYYLNNNSFPVDPLFYNSIAGFANLTSVQNLTVFVTLWDMYEVDANYSTARIDGLSPSYENASIPLDLEPITGNALYYNLKLQLNLLVPNNTWFADQIVSPSPYASFPQDIYLPIFKIGQTANPGQSSINLLKSQFKQMKTARIAPVAVGAVVGSLMVVLGILISVLIFHRREQRKQHQGYLAING
ncbi:hypothetical protein CYY_001361 [Polysphondylium violaceum]|uniref:Lysosomal integral membrane protein II n=1 Tax=Polysphondylium violaceum TaxID=133409 RepID=A0A8J4PYC7_9MYCE|nr:hypothetical protein CYY_001361 [Polysphondylium violaceum]